MPLSKTQLIADLKAAFEAPEQITGPKDPPGRQQELQREKLVEKLADTIEAYVKSADVTQVKVDVNSGSQVGVGRLG